MFSPHRCPYPSCPAHKIEQLEDYSQQRRFYIRYGSYRPDCRAHPVPRFRCLECRRTFSRQTFRADYRDHKPHLNAQLLELLANGLGLRQAARIVKMTRRCTELKARKICRHLERLSRNTADQLPEGCSFQMDEMETFEDERTVKPLTVPMLIEQESMYIVDARSAPIRPSGRMSNRRLLAIARKEEAEGRRRSGSSRAVRGVLQEGARLCKQLSRVRIDTDEKSTYPVLIRKVFGEHHDHRPSSSELPRDTRNPLFPINHMNAMARYLTGRLRRRSWLASKRGQFLNVQLCAFRAYMNLVRPRFNGERKTPAMVLGFVREVFRPTDLVGWRQDWGWFSPHPLDGRMTIRAARSRDRALGRASFQRPVEKRGFAG